PPALASLSLHDALPIFWRFSATRLMRLPPSVGARRHASVRATVVVISDRPSEEVSSNRAILATNERTSVSALWSAAIRLASRSKDRKSTRLNSSHDQNS